MRYITILLVIIILLLAVIAAFTVRLTHQTRDNLAVSPAISRSESPAANPTPTPANIRITSPTNGQSVSATFTVSGKARVFENQFDYVIATQHGSKVLSGTITAVGKPEDGFVPFSKEITLSPLPSEQHIVLEVFDYSPKDGSKMDTVRVPLVFSK